MKKRYVTYIRVSTQKQGRSGLGLESQQSICNGFIEANDGERVAEFCDVESGTHRDRKGLADAVAYCKKNDCALVIAKLDRLARDVEFCFKVINTGIEIHFCDMPQINTLLLGVFAAVAQYERELTSDRTKKALKALKERGGKMGAASEKYAERYKSKSKEEKKTVSLKRGKTRNERYVNSRDVQVFLKVLKNVFPEACTDKDAGCWHWDKITTKGDAKTKIIALMRDYKELDGSLFATWNFEEPERHRYDWQMRLNTRIHSVRKAVRYKIIINS